MPEYRGVNLKDVPVESDLFEGYKFSTYHARYCRRIVTGIDSAVPSVVSSDPKSQTGAEDKQALLQMYESLTLLATATTSDNCPSHIQDSCAWGQVRPIRTRRPEPACGLRRANHS